MPTYDPQTVYVETAPAPVYVETTADAGAAIGAGTIGFVSSVTVAAVLDDDWDDYCRGSTGTTDTSTRARTSTSKSTATSTSMVR